MYEILKAIATAQGWNFEYGRRDFDNLFSEIEDKTQKYLFLDPVKTKRVKNKEGVVEAETQQGTFMILMSSSLDELSYNDRYNTYIKPLIDTDNAIIEEAIRCGYDAEVKEWTITEVINLFDYNFDGIIVSFLVNFDA